MSLAYCSIRRRIRDRFTEFHDDRDFYVILILSIPIMTRSGLKSMDNDELIDMHLRLQALQLEHRDLDAAISALQAHHYPDQLQLTRMKRRKLQLKDTISRLESKLIPDLNA